MPISDRYKLQQSAPVVLEGNREESVNLSLQAQPAASVGQIQGTVAAANGSRIEGATVQLFNSQGAPIQHVNSNPQGQFVFPDIQVGSYFITASEPGYLTPLRTPLSVSQGRSTTVTITMQTDTAATTGAVFGIVRDNATSQPINNATVNLFQTSGSTITQLGSVTSNASGQYLFANLASGTYYVQSSISGYLPNQSAPVGISGTEYAPLDINLAADPNANTGTLSGIITDSSSGAAVPGALVALYAINNGVENVVQITRANEGGLYLFGDLAAGTYRVKATVQVNT
ncbi:carboxypeptidase-like regulatory domain-containing protein [Paenibacillus sp. JX-17]|uniref:Carboxypeptidase-like regulatory domain-containing protein n=1 Tax=Paenibacillus lacisoli TaxID=3064525 RepID=A0ABT9C6E7_9BACL|nr:carboxypeptidase-like regulatory domain-containing protein [Paenibacillus sp. JX-17]MDO7904834.1 carboxypeptidase-like regulatory domain-containing protein [Paenibacillus sp. JX-17]